MDGWIEKETRRGARIDRIEIGGRKNEMTAFLNISFVSSAVTGIKLEVTLTW